MMKKLSLKNLKLEASEMLGRNQLKTVFGGGYPGIGDCNDDCSYDTDCPDGTVCKCFYVERCKDENYPLSRWVIPPF